MRSIAVLALCSLCWAAERPKEAFIDGHHWKIKWLLKVPLGTDYDGETECRTRTIFVQIQLCDDRLERETLQHELLHAFVCENGAPNNLRYNSSNTDKHEGIYFLAPKLVEFMRQNPRVVKFLGESNGWGP